MSKQIFKKYAFSFFLLFLFCILNNTTIFAEETIVPVKDQVINIELGKDYYIKGSAEPGIRIVVPDKYKNTIRISGLETDSMDVGTPIIQIGKECDMTIEIMDIVELYSDTTAIKVGSKSKVHFTGEGMISMDLESDTANYLVDSADNDVKITVDTFCWCVNSETNAYNRPSTVTVNSQRHMDYANNIVNPPTSAEFDHIADLFNQNQNPGGAGGGGGGGGDDGGGDGGGGGGGGGGGNGDEDKSTVYISSSGYSYSANGSFQSSMPDLTKTTDFVVLDNTTRTIKLLNKNINTMTIGKNANITISFSNSNISSITSNADFPIYSTVKFHGVNTGTIDFYGTNTHMLFQQISGLTGSTNITFASLSLEKGNFEVTHDVTITATSATFESVNVKMSEGRVNFLNFLENNGLMDFKVKNTTKTMNAGFSKNTDISNLTGQNVIVYPLINNLSSNIGDIANKQIAYRVNNGDWFWTYTDELARVYIPLDTQINKNTIEVKFKNDYYDAFSLPHDTVFTKEIASPYSYRKIYLIDPQIITIDFAQPTESFTESLDFTLWGWNIFGEFIVDFVEVDPETGEEYTYHTLVFTKNGETLALKDLENSINYDSPLELELRLSLDGNLIYTHPTKLIIPAPLSSTTDIVSFDIPNNTRTYISNYEQTVDITMPYDTDLTSLTPTITIAPGATISPSSGVAQDFTSPKIYTVTAPDGTVSEYTVTVSKEGTPKITTVTTSTPDNNGIINVYFSGQDLPDNIYMIATPNSGANVITTGNFQKNYNHYNSNITIPASVLNSSNSTTYTLKFYDASNNLEIINASNKNTIFIEKTYQTTNSITAFEISGQLRTDIDQNNKTITVVLPYNYVVGTNQIPTTLIHTGVNISPPSSTSINISLTTPVKYKVFAEDNSVCEYTVYFVKEGIPTINNISYSTELNYTGGNQTIVLSGNNLSTANSITATIMGDGFHQNVPMNITNTSATATISIPQNHTNIIKTYYIYIKIDNTTYNFPITHSFTVKPQLSTQHSITSFKLPGQKSSTISGNNISVTMPYTVTNKTLIPTISYSTNANIQPAPGIAVDFSKPVTYTVTAEDGLSQTTYTVLVTFEGIPTPTDISFDNPPPKGATIAIEIEGTNLRNANRVDIVLTPNNGDFATITERVNVSSNTSAYVSVDIPLNNSDRTVSYNIKLKIDDLTYPSNKSVVINPAIYSDNKILTMRVEGATSVLIKENEIEVTMAKGTNLLNVQTSLTASLGAQILDLSDTYNYNRDFQIVVESQTGEFRSYTVKTKIDQTVYVQSAEIIENSTNNYTINIKGINLQNINRATLYLKNKTNDTIVYTFAVDNSNTDYNGETYFIINTNELRNSNVYDEKYYVSLTYDDMEIDFPNSIITVPSSLTPDNNIERFIVQNSKNVEINNDRITVEVPFYFNVTNVAPTINISTGATITPASGEYRNFSTPQQYIVTSANGQTKTYTITFVKDATPTFESLSFTNPSYDGGQVEISLSGNNLNVIDSLSIRVYDQTGAYTEYPFTNNSVIVNIPANQSTTKKTYNLKIVADNQVFDMTEKIEVMPRDDGGNSILSFELDDAISVDILENEINVLMPFGYDLSNLHPIYTTSVGATISKQLSGIDYTSPVTVSLISEQGVNRDYTITIETENINTVSIENTNYNNMLYPSGGLNNIMVEFNKSLYDAIVTISIKKGDTYNDYTLSTNNGINYSADINFEENDTHEDILYYFDVYVNNTKIQTNQYNTNFDNLITVKGLDPINPMVQSINIIDAINTQINNQNKTIEITMPYNWISTEYLTIQGVQFNVADISFETDTIPFKLNESIPINVLYKNQELVSTFEITIKIEKRPSIISFDGPTEVDATGGIIEFNLITQNIAKDGFTAFLVAGTKKIEGVIYENDTDDYLVVFGIPQNNTENNIIYNIELYLNDALQGLELKTLCQTKGADIFISDFIVEDSVDVIINENDKIISLLMPHGTDLSNINYQLILDNGLSYELLTNDDFSEIVSFKIYNAGGRYEIYSVLTTLDAPEIPTEITAFNYIFDANSKLSLIINTQNIKETDEITIVQYLNEVEIERSSIDIDNNYAKVDTDISEFKSTSDDMTYSFEIYLNETLVETIEYEVQNEPVPVIDSISRKTVPNTGDSINLVFDGENLKVLNNANIMLKTGTIEIPMHTFKLENNKFIGTFLVPLNDTYSDLTYDVIVEFNGETEVFNDIVTVKRKEIPIVSFVIKLPNEIKQSVSNNEITITVPHDTDLTQLLPEITIPSEYTVDRELNVITDYSSPVEYTLSFDNYSFAYVVKVVKANPPKVTKIKFKEPTSYKKQEIEFEVQGENLDLADSIKITVESDTKKITEIFKYENNKYIAVVEIPKNSSSSQKEYTVTIYIDGQKQNISKTFNMPKDSSSSSSGGGGGGGGGGGFKPSTPSTKPDIPSTPVVTPPVTEPPISQPPVIEEPKQQFAINISKPYIQGYLDGSFQPQNNITRAEVATIISRIVDGYSDAIDYTNTFGDVYSVDWYENYVSFASEKGIINGSYGNYRPKENITRAEFSAIIYRLLKEESVATSIFPDVQNTFFEKEIAVLTNKGIISGYLDGTFKPNAPITRAEAVKMINTAFNIPNKNIVTTFWDVPADFWAYNYINNACN